MGERLGKLPYKNSKDLPKQNSKAKVYSLESLLEIIDKKEIDEKEIDKKESVLVKRNLIVVSDFDNFVSGVDFCGFLL